MIRFLTIMQWIMGIILFLLYWQEILLILLVLSGLAWATLSLFHKPLVQLIMWYEEKGYLIVKKVKILARNYIK